jgi:hypothetical protein
MARARRRAVTAPMLVVQVCAHPLNRITVELMHSTCATHVCMSSVMETTVSPWRMNACTSYGSVLLQSTRSYRAQCIVHSSNACMNERARLVCPINSACRRVHAFMHTHPSMMGSRSCSG